MTDTPLTALRELDRDVLLLSMNAPDFGDTDIIKGFRDLLERVGPFYLITDLTEVKTLGRGAADDGPDMLRSEWFKAVIYINASRTVRMLLKVFNMGMFLKGQRDFPMIFTNSLEEALQAVEDLRAKGNQE
ncbi:MAG TPA: hypothetical protein VK013_13330 [Myxococcaceae bacterium]|nr:hypothetical protein [Myxococcaceae bacterium]